MLYIKWLLVLLIDENTYLKYYVLIKDVNDSAYIVVAFTVVDKHYINTLCS